MGSLGSKNLKRFSSDFQTSYDFEVYPLAQSDQTSQSSHIMSNIWCVLRFTHKKSGLVVSKDGQKIEKIALDSGFEVANEQEADLIFTIKFSSDNDIVSRWKIRCRNIEEYHECIALLKKGLRNEWKESKSCQGCSKKFGMFLRKHHCRKCGKCICDNCSPIRSTLPELAYADMVRICLACGKNIEANRKGLFHLNTPNFTHLK